MVRKHNGALEFIGGQNCETRNESTAKLISISDYTYSFNDFDWIVINTGDKDEYRVVEGYDVYSYSTSNEDYSKTVPDFIFDCWPQTQLDDYGKTTRKMAEIGNSLPMTDKLGWRGAITHSSRNYLLNFNDKTLFDIEEIRWDRSNPDRLTCHNFVSLEDSVRNWRYLIDVEGHGWSARMKLFLFSRRVLFLQDRPYKEWFYPKMIPMVHYVPVKRNLSDLDEKLDMIKSNPELEKYIINSSYEFATQNLTRKNAIERWREILNEL
jgi:hypothetical protein